MVCSMSYLTAEEVCGPNPKEVTSGFPEKKFPNAFVDDHWDDKDIDEQSIFILISIPPLSHRENVVSPFWAHPSPPLREECRS